jgi:hypothetical protein
MQLICQMTKDNKLNDERDEYPQGTIELKVLGPILNGLGVIQVPPEESQLIVVWLIKWVLNSISLKVV